MSLLPTYQDVVAAAGVIDGHAIKTPLIESQLLNDQLGARIFFKAECLQRTGSFKFRGAFNALSNLDDVKGEEGVLACSSGNHAQGVAEAARLMGTRATILMPSDAPRSKKDRTTRSGATIVEYDRHRENREEIVEAMAQSSGARIVHPYETFHVIAGQGTCGLEICQELQTRGLELDHILVCTGGGGLLAGTLLAAKEHFPSALIHSVEPQNYDDQKRSHLAGERLPIESNQSSVCDAIMTPMPGEKSFEICKGQLGEGLTVTDEEALRAVAFAFHELKLVVEPGGAVTLAALLSGKLDVKGKTVAATLSGGNIDPDMMARALVM